MRKIPTGLDGNRFFRRPTTQVRFYSNNPKMTPSKFSIALIPGDGIGREVIQSAKEVLQATKIPFVFEELQAGWETFQKTKYALPPETVHRLLSGGYVGAMFGAVSSPVRRVDGYSSPIIALRKTLDLYANLRPVESDDSNSFKKTHSLNDRSRKHRVFICQVGKVIYFTGWH